MSQVIPFFDNNWEQLTSENHTMAKVDFEAWIKSIKDRSSKEVRHPLEKIIVTSIVRYVDLLSSENSE